MLNNKPIKSQVDLPRVFDLNSYRFELQTCFKRFKFHAVVTSSWLIGFFGTSPYCIFFPLPMTLVTFLIYYLLVAVPRQVLQSSKKCITRLSVTIDTCFAGPLTHVHYVVSKILKTKTPSKISHSKRFKLLG